MEIYLGETIGPYLKNISHHKLQYHWHVSSITMNHSLVSYVYLEIHYTSCRNLFKTGDHMYAHTHGYLCNWDFVLRRVQEEGELSGKG